jgi:hypothetical protein
MGVGWGNSTNYMVTTSVSSPKLLLPTFTSGRSEGENRRVCCFSGPVFSSLHGSTVIALGSIMYTTFLYKGEPFKWLKTIICCHLHSPPPPPVVLGFEFRALCFLSKQTLYHLSHASSPHLHYFYRQTRNGITVWRSFSERS